MHLRLPLSLAASALLLCPFASASVRPHRHSSAHAIVRRSASAHSSHASHVEHASYAGIDTERATEIQTALIQRGYLSGAPTGSWDSSTAAAMQKLQSDNGWQTKLVPDSRALIKLGLGPGSTPSASSGMPSVAAASLPQTGQTF